MWPIDNEGIMIADSGGAGSNFGVSQDNTDSDDHSITVYFQFRDGEVHSRTLKASNLYIEDMFRLQDPELCDSSPNDPREDLCETPKVDLNGLCTNETQDDPDINLNVLCDNDTPGEMSETPQVHLNALCTNESQDDLSLTPDLDFNVCRVAASVVSCVGN